MALEIIGSRVELVTVFLLNGHEVKLPSKHYIYAHRTKLLSTLVKEVSFYTGQQLMRD